MFLKIIKSLLPVFFFLIAPKDYKRFLSQSQDLELQLCSKEKELEQLFQKQRMVSERCQEVDA